MDSATQTEQYGIALEKYLLTRSEDALYEASLLTEQFIRDGLGPEDITLMHCESVHELLEAADGRTQLDRLRGLGDAHQFLLELMISYGVKYREHAERVLAESLREIEAASGERERAELLAMILLAGRVPTGHRLASARVPDRRSPPQASFFDRAAGHS